MISQDFYKLQKLVFLPEISPSICGCLFLPDQFLYSDNFSMKQEIWRILTDFKIIQDFIEGLVACKNGEDPIKMKALERSQHCSLIFQMLNDS